MNKLLASIITGVAIGLLTTYLGYNFMTWQFWTFIGINVISLTSRS